MISPLLREIKYPSTPSSSSTFADCGCTNWLNAWVSPAYGLEKSLAFSGMLVSGVFGRAPGDAVTSLRSLLGSGEDGADSACVIGDGRLPLVAIGVFWPSFDRRSERRGFFLSSGLDSPFVP